MTEITEEKIERAVEDAPAWLQTKFGKWAKDYGVAKLVHELRTRGHSMTDSALYYWLRGDTVPRHDKAQELVRIAGGALSLHDIFTHRDELKAADKA